MANPRICSIDECDKLAVARGWCDLHYQRWRSHGDPSLAPKRLGACLVPDCGRLAVSRDLCDGHYSRWKIYRDVKPDVPLRKKSKPAPAGGGLKFIIDVAMNHASDDCLLFPFGKSSNGYGSVDVNGKKRGSHVVACEIMHGLSPDPSFEVAHSCGNRLCCNPRHLRWSSRMENHADKLVHGTAQRGKNGGRTKLTEDDVRKIRSMKGKLSNNKIAKQFGVNQGTIHCILVRSTWAWLE